MRRSHGPYTIGLLSTPAPHNSRNPSHPLPTNFPATFTTTPMEHLDFTLSQISPGLGVENLQPPVSSPPPHKSSPTPSASSPVATPSSYPRYESVFKSRYSATTPLATLSVRGTSTTTTTSSAFPSSRIYTISTPTALRDPGSNSLSAFTSISSPLKPHENSPLSTLSTFTAASTGPSSTTFIQTTALTGQIPSPERAVKVTLDASLGYDNLHYEPDSSQPKTNLEAWQAKQKAREKQQERRQGGLWEGAAVLGGPPASSPTVPLLPHGGDGAPPPPPRLTAGYKREVPSGSPSPGGSSPVMRSPRTPRQSKTPPPPPRRRLPQTQLSPGQHTKL
ncbi:hypothetical protein FHG87_002980, partial [Trinorchestia longiramus]